MILSEHRSRSIELDADPPAGAAGGEVMGDKAGALPFVEGEVEGEGLGEQGIDDVLLQGHVIGSGSGDLRFW